MGYPSYQQYAQPADLANLGLSAQALSVITLPEQNAALLKASNEADGYLNTRFTLPLISWGADLTGHVCAIAAYRLMVVRGYNPEANNSLRKSFEDAIKWLTDVAANRVNPIIVDGSSAPGGIPDGQAGPSGFAQSIGSPANRPGYCGDVDGGGITNFWKNSVAASYALKGRGGTTRGF